MKAKGNYPMKHMKNLVCILLCLFVLTSCSTPKEENPYLTNIKEQVQAADKLLGVAFLGTADGDFKAVKTHIQSQEYTKVYPFFGEIDDSHYVKEEGSELYCIVPADNSVSVSVYNTQLNEDTYLLEQKDKLLSHTDGQPLLLCGNISDIMPNLMVVAQKGDVTVTYTPHLSLENGLLGNYDGTVVDFSPYELMANFNGLNPDVEWNFFGDWVCTVTDAKYGDIDMQLSLSADGIIFSYASETLTGYYTGDWLILSDQRLRLELGGSTQDSEMPGAVGYHTDVDGIYYWDVQDDGTLLLTYLNGTPLYPSSTVSEFPFVPAN